MAILLSILLVVTSSVIHYEALWQINRLLPKLMFFKRRASVPVAILGAMMSHLAHVAMFASVYYMMSLNSGPDIVGNLKHMNFGDFFYFSIETYTSLGLGDIYPLPSLRLLVGIESITGLLMISWTASFTYLEMQRYWPGPSAKSTP